MKTLHDSLAASEEKPAKSRLFFAALGLSALLVSAVGGGVTFMIYHQFSSMPAGPQAATSHAQTERLAPAPLVAPQAENHSDYRRVDNTVLPPAEARRVIAAWKSNPVVSNVPPPLAKTAQETSQEVGNRPPLSDPDSHYIVSDRTGQVIGVDGSASVTAEIRQAQAIPAVAVAHAPSVEVRLASAVQVRAAVPVVPGDEDTADQQGSGVSAGAQYVPARQAQPVATGRNFNAANYLAAEDEHPVLRAQAVTAPASRDAAYRPNFRLPDFGSR